MKEAGSKPAGEAVTSGNPHFRFNLSISNLKHFLPVGFQVRLGLKEGIPEALFSPSIHLS